MTSPKQRPVDVTDRPVVGLMSQPVFAVPAGASLDDALRVLLVAGRRHLVAVDAGGRFVGVLGARQVAAAWARDPGSLDTVLVETVLDACPPIVSPTATVRTVARVMRDHQTDVVVVVDAGHVAVGVVTAGDVVAAVAGPRRAAPGMAIAVAAR